MHKFTKLCLKKPVSTVIIIMALVIFAIASITGMNMQLTPDMNMPMIIVYTVYPGAGPDEVDRLVSQELEDVGATITGLDSINSRSMENVSYMIYSFEYGTDIDKAYNDLQQEINTASRDLPEGCKSPVLIEMDINAMPSIMLSITTESGTDVRGFAENTLDPALKAIPNVASTDISGGQEDYIKVEINPQLLEQYGLTMSGVTGMVSSANFSIPSGSVEVGSQTMNVNAQVDYSDIYDLGNIPLMTNTGNTVKLSDVAEIYYAKKTADSVSHYGGKDTVSYSITKQQGSNAVKLSRDVMEIVDRFAEIYPDMEIAVTYDSRDSIISALSSVGKTLVLGVFLSMLVLFIFFGDIKASLIVGSSMPVSLLVTILLMYSQGYSLNVVTLGAMVIGIGMMVDNSIVVLEMCFQKKDQGLSFEDSAYDAVKTVATSIFASTLTTVVVYLPLALLKGLSGQMFSQLGFTIIFSLTASLISAVTLVPLCFAKYHPIEKKDFVIAKSVKKLAQVYGKILDKVLRHKLIVIIITVVLVVLTGVIFTQVHTELMTATDEGQVSVSAAVRPGLSIENKAELLNQLEEFVAQDPDVETYSSSASEGSSNISLTAYLKKDRSRETQQVVDAWNEELAGTVNMEVNCSSSSSSSMGGMGGDSKEVDIKSTDMNALKEASVLIADAVRGVDGVTNVTTDFSDSSAKAEIRIDPMKAAGAGVVPAQAGSAIYAAQNGTDAMDITINEKDYKVTVEYPEGRYDTVEKLMAMSIPTNYGANVALSDIAVIEYTDSPQTIYRADGYYQVGVTATLNSEKKFEAQAEIDKIVSGLRLPANVYHAEDTYTKMMSEEFMSIFKAILIALWLVFMVMTMQFESARYSGMIMFCIPFSLIGSVFLLWITQSTLSMTSLMGFLMLEGIVVNNGILMVDTTNQFMEDMEMDKALVEAGKSRLRPILMTTLTTILSMLPLAIGIGSNADTMKGMAIVIVGGLVASTILTLILLPTFYIIIAKKDKNKVGQQE